MLNRLDPAQYAVAPQLTESSGKELQRTNHMRWLHEAAAAHYRAQRMNMPDGLINTRHRTVLELMRALKTDYPDIDPVEIVKGARDMMKGLIDEQERRAE